MRARTHMHARTHIHTHAHSQGIVWVLGVSVVLVNVLNAALHAILIFGAGMGIRSVLASHLLS